MVVFCTHQCRYWESNSGCGGHTFCDSRDSLCYPRCDADGTCNSLGMTGVTCTSITDFVTGLQVGICK
jgi:hypothetical protein